MSSVLGAFFLIMIAGGCIAYFGDRLGYIMGKRRVTLFGLRPRHTAQTLTVISGIVIGALALTLLLIVNYTFRFALLNGKQLLLTNHNLKLTNRILDKEANENRITAQIAQTAAVAAQNQANSATAVLHTSEQNLALEEKKTASIQQQLDVKQSVLRQLTSKLEDERVQLNTVQSRVTQANLQLGEALQRGYQEFKTRRNANLIYRNGQELGRDVISASEPITDIRLELIRFLNRMSRTAEVMGATTGSNNRAVVLASINLVNREPGSQPTPDSVAFVGEDGSIDALASSISSLGHGSIVVIAKAFGNSYNGEQVVVLLRPYENLLAIQAGTVLGSTTIAQGSASADEIVDQLQRFLVEVVRPTAIKAGVIPTYDPQVGTVELGDVSLDQIYDVVHRVQDISGPAIITAITASDTYSADKLALTFSVKPASDSSE